ncbi:MAG: CHAT domain-containing protein [Acidobacteriota bacterium]|nr:CHAT domain-containing protein [Acidobacteriota bacterium]
MNYQRRALTLALSYAAIFSGVSPLLAAPTRSAPPPASVRAQGPPAAQGADALRQGRRLLRRGRTDQALPLLENALKLAKESGAAGAQARAFDALGDLYALLGQHAVALKHYQSAHENFLAAEAKEGLLQKAVGIGENKFNSELMLAKIAETHYRLGNNSESASAYQRISVAKPDTGAVTTAKKGFGFLSSVKSAVTGPPSASTVTEGVGLASKIQEAIALYHQVIIYTNQELGLGRIDFQNNQLDSAKKHFENALAVAGGNNPLIANLGQTRRFRVAARTGLGDVALRQGKSKDALKFYADAANGAKADKRLDLMWPAQRGTGKARLLAAANEKDTQKKLKTMNEAAASYREALATIETIRQGSLRADDARTTFLATTEDVFDEASGALAEMALMSAPAGAATLDGQSLAYAAEAFRIVEQGRARSLLDMLSESRAEITEGVPAELLKRKQENLEQQQDIAQQLTGVSLTNEPPQESLDKLEGKLETLAVEYDSIENQIRAASPRYASLTAAQPLTLEAVQQNILDDQTVLLEYSLGNENSYLWAVTNKGVAIHRLPARAAIQEQAAALRDQIVPQSLRRSIVELAGSPVRGLADDRGLGVASGAASGGGDGGTFAGVSHTLYQTTIAPAAALIKDKRLLVVADGALNYIPFEALVTTAGGTDYSALPYLINANEIVYAPSASVVAAIRQQSSGNAAAANARGLLVIADPVFDSTDPRAKSAAAATTATTTSTARVVESAIADVAGDKAAAAQASGGSGIRLARLNGTRAEAQQIAQLARTASLAPDVWLDFDANEANVKARDISKYRVLHIATHGLLNAERPQFTGVVLSLVGNREGDGFLRTDEIFNLRLGSPLVMLSACETGLGKEKRGEGVIGLTRAFMYAGAPTVGVSLWSVADRSTAELMADFYKRLLTKQATTPAAALRAAQQQMITGKKYSAPFYWAPFVLVGDWR